MPDAARELWITGIGIASCLGEGADAHWQALCERRTKVDGEHFAPYLVHPFAAVDFDKQIPKKSDQRQMENWQRMGVYAAGLALDSAGVKGNADLLSKMDMLVAAGAGERDTDVDLSILDGLRRTENREAYLNQRLLNDLRPTSCIASSRSNSTGRSRRRATSGRWRRGSASAPMPRGWPSTMPGRAAWSPRWI